MYLRKSGRFYQATLDSLMKQKLAPSAIIVYFAEGYTLSKETVGTVFLRFPGGSGDVLQDAFFGNEDSYLFLSIH